MSSRLHQFRFLGFLWICFALTGFAQQDEWNNVKRIVAVGDIHGDYEHYIEVLRAAGIVNKRGNWDADETHFVQVGDLPDRGPDTAKIIRHMQKLESQAEKRGGKVHALIGNHEMMNMTGDLRYVVPGEYKALKSRSAKKLQNDYYQRFVDYALSQQEQNQEEASLIIDKAYRAEWEEKYPLGYVEHRVAWSPAGEFGEWVLGHNAVIKINNILFLHGGIGPKMPKMSLHELNEKVRAELAVEFIDEGSLLTMDDGPLWYRGLASNDEELELANLENILNDFDVEYIVIGHTPGMGTIIPRFNSKVLLIDTGISAYYGGHLASLLIENGEFETVQGGETIVIPKDELGLPSYYQRITALDEGTERLNSLINNLGLESSSSSK